MGSREKDMDHQPAPTTVLGVKGGSQLPSCEEGTHTHATHKGPPELYASANGEPGGMEGWLDTPQNLLHFWDGGWLQIPKMGWVERKMPKTHD